LKTLAKLNFRERFLFLTCKQSRFRTDRAVVAGRGVVSLRRPDQLLELIGKRAQHGGVFFRVLAFDRKTEGCTLRR